MRSISDTVNLSISTISMILKQERPDTLCRVDALESFPSRAHAVCDDLCSLAILRERFHLSCASRALPMLFLSLSEFRCTVSDTKVESVSESSTCPSAIASFGWTLPRPMSTGQRTTGLQLCGRKFSGKRKEGLAKCTNKVQKLYLARGLAGT